MVFHILKLRRKICNGCLKKKQKTQKTYFLVPEFSMTTGKRRRIEAL